MTNWINVGYFKTSFSWCFRIIFEKFSNVFARRCKPSCSKSVVTAIRFAVKHQLFCNKNCAKYIPKLIYFEKSNKASLHQIDWINRQENFDELKLWDLVFSRHDFETGWFFKPHQLARVAMTDGIVLMSVFAVLPVLILCIWSPSVVPSRAAKRVQRYTIDE